MDASNSIAALRLVGHDADGAARARREVERANRESARLTTEDAWAIFALRVSESLEGGRAAILTLERRRRLMRLASMLGVREFDATLVIAMVQDAARRGETAHDAASLHRLGASRRPRPDHSIASSVMTAVALGLLVFAILVGWVLL